MEYRQHYQLEEALQRETGGIRKGIKVLIVGSSASYKSGFLHYLVAQMMRNQLQNPFSDPVRLQWTTWEESPAQLAMRSVAAIYMLEGFVRGNGPYPSLSQEFKARKRHSRKLARHAYRHNYQSTYVEKFYTKDEEANLNEKVEITGDNITTIEVKNIHRLESGSLAQLSDIGHRLALDPSYVFYTYRENGLAYVKVLKARGHIFTGNPIPLTKVNNYHGWRQPIETI